MNEKLKPCPFCGSQRVEVAVPLISESNLPENGNFVPEAYVVMCLDCGNGGAVNSDENAAIEAWNRREPELPADVNESGLKPCPFCGNRDVSYLDIYEEPCGVLITCENCGTASPLVETREEAAAIWNRRVVQAERGGQS